MSLRIGVIGCGLVAVRSHLPAFAACDDADLVAVASGRVANARAAAERFGVLTVHDRWEALVEDPDVDAVSICTPNGLHAQMAIAAARAGKHVLVEKPMCTSVADADAMIAEAEAAGVLLMVAHNLRYAPVYEELKRIVASGVIGRLIVARGVFAHMGPDESWGATSDWFWDPALAGGGAMLDLGVHIIDLMRWLIDRPVMEVSAMVSRTLKPTADEDNALALLRFEGDVLCSIQTGWTARPGRDSEVVIQGERGRVVMRPSRTEPIRMQLLDGEAPTPAIAAESDLVNPFEHFVRCVLDGAQPRTSAREGRDTLAVALACYESARTGRTVTPA